MSEIRLHVLLSRAGVASRRKAETLIKAGRVEVNGEVVRTLGAKADPERDRVAVDGVYVGARQPPTTLVLNKPVEVVTTLSDPEARETVADLVADEPYRFLPVGRLDYHTEGLLLMTTDGELSHRLLHPKYHVAKVYQVKVRGRPGRHALDRLREGVMLEDGQTRPAIVELLEDGERATWIEIVVAEGRNRLVRRMCDEVGHPALRVVRTELATIGLGGLKPGQFRYLLPAELAALYRTAHLPIPEELPERAEAAQRLILGAARRGKGPLPGDPRRRGGSASAGFDQDRRDQGPRSRRRDDERGRRPIKRGDRRQDALGRGGRRTGEPWSDRRADEAASREGRGHDHHSPLRGGRGGRFSDSDRRQRSGRFSDSERPRGGRGGRFSDSDRSRDDGGGRFSDSERPRGGRGGRFSAERRGGRPFDDDRWDDRRTSRPRGGDRFFGDRGQQTEGRRGDRRRDVDDRWDSGGR
ncbi:MAG: pseudouridine synthase, partial [Myxococcota bacterium]